MLKPIHPGQILKEEWIDEGFSKEKIISRSNFPENLLDNFIAGKLDVSDSISHWLSLATGTTREFWINLQLLHDKQLKEYLKDK